MNKEVNVQKGQVEEEKRGKGPLTFGRESDIAGLISMMLVGVALILFNNYKGQPNQDILAMFWGVMFGATIHQGIVKKNRKIIMLAILYFVIMAANIMLYVTSDF